MNYEVYVNGTLNTASNDAAIAISAMTREISELQNTHKEGTHHVEIKLWPENQFVRFTVEIGNLEK